MARITPASCLVGLLLAVFVCGNGIAGTQPAPPPPSIGLSQLGERLFEEYKKPAYAESRCMLSPVFSSDGTTVAVSVDRVFSAGDVITTVGDEQLDTTAKTPVRDILLKHGPNEILQVKIRRADKELVVTAKCADAKPIYDLMLESAFAASKNDAPTCADKFDAAARLQKPYYGQLALAYQCYFYARRFSNIADNSRKAYEMYRQLILESAWSPDALSNIRGTILNAVDGLQKHNASVLADDLRQQYDQAVSAKLSPKTAATTGSR
jgi:hypothetical protein